MSILSCIRGGAPISPLGHTCLRLELAFHFYSECRAPRVSLSPGRETKQRKETGHTAANFCKHVKEENKEANSAANFRRRSLLGLPPFFAVELPPNKDMSLATSRKRGPVCSACLLKWTQIHGPPISPMTPGNFGAIVKGLRQRGCFYLEASKRAVPSVRPLACSSIRSCRSIFVKPLVVMCVRGAPFQLTLLRYIERDGQVLAEMFYCDVLSMKYELWCFYVYVYAYELNKSLLDVWNLDERLCRE